MSVAPGLLAGYEQLQGKELSYNNIADSDAAWECVRSFDVPACVIIKHANPCGVAVAATHEEAYAKAFLTDSKSAFGGIIAFNGPVTRSCAERISHQFAEVIIAPEFDEGALELFGQKKNLRLLKIALGSAHNDFEFKRVGGGLLVQTPDIQLATEADLRDEEGSDAQADQRHALCVECCSLCEVQHNRLCQGRHDAWRGRRPDEPS